MMSRLILPDFLLKLSIISTPNLHIHSSIQKNFNLMIQILKNYFLFNITSFHQELKGEHMKDQVRLLIQ